MKCPRRRRPTWAFSWPYIRWIREELRGGQWVELSVDPSIEQAYADVNEVLERPGTTAAKKEALEKVMRYHADSLAKLDDDPKV